MAHYRSWLATGHGPVEKIGHHAARRKMMRNAPWWPFSRSVKVAAQPARLLLD